jgi:hypothetical protein
MTSRWNPTQGPAEMNTLTIAKPQPIGTDTADDTTCRLAAPARVAA